MAWKRGTKRFSTVELPITVAEKLGGEKWEKLLKFEYGKWPFLATALVIAILSFAAAFLHIEDSKGVVLEFKELIERTRWPCACRADFGGLGRLLCPASDSSGRQCQAQSIKCGSGFVRPGLASAVRLLPMIKETRTDRGGSCHGPRMNGHANGS